MFLRLMLFHIVSIAIASAQAATTDVDHSRKVDPLRPGVIEVGISAGWATGNIGGAHLNLQEVIDYRIKGHNGPSGELHLGVGVSARLEFLADAAILSGGRARQDLGEGYTIETKAAAVVYGAALHVRFPRVHRSVPYLAAGLGSVQSRTDTLVLYSNPTHAPGAIVSAATQVRLKEGSLAPTAGVGMHFFAPHARIGIRLESKAYFPTGSSRTPFLQVSVGVFTWLR